MIMGKTESVILYLCIYMASGFLFTLGVRAKRGGGPFFILAILIPVVFAANRYFVGTDYGTYLNKYHYLAEHSFSEVLLGEGGLREIVIYVISRVSMFCGGEHAFFGVFALATYLPVGVTIKKDYRNVSLFLVILLFLTGLFTNSMNIIRQVAAVSLCFYGLQFVYKRNPWKYTAIIAIATLFHTSAIVGIIAYFLWDKHTQTTPFFASFLTTCGIILSTFTFREILQVATRLPFFSNYSIYLDDTTQANNYLILVHIAIYVLLFFVRKQMNALDKRNRLLYLLTFIGICLEFTGFSLVYAKRIAMYFYELPSIVLIAQTPLLFRGRMRSIVYIGVILFAISLFIIEYAVLGHSNVIPYRV